MKEERREGWRPMCGIQFHFLETLADFPSSENLSHNDISPQLTWEGGRGSCSMTVREWQVLTKAVSTLKNVCLSLKDQPFQILKYNKSLLWVSKREPHHLSQIE